MTFLGEGQRTSCVSYFGASIFSQQAQLAEKTTLLSEARLKEQEFIERVSIGPCVFSSAGSAVNLLQCIPRNLWPPARAATALLLHSFNCRSHLLTFGLTL